ncbi:Nn.00g108440.m01.CDS01 [Neocucurbitaria sp. VM-36]
MVAEKLVGEPGLGLVLDEEPDGSEDVSGVAEVKSSDRLESVNKGEDEELNPAPISDNDNRTVELIVSGADSVENRVKTLVRSEVMRVVVVVCTIETLVTEGAVGQVDSSDKEIVNIPLPVDVNRLKYKPEGLFKSADVCVVTTFDVADMPRVDVILGGIPISRVVDVRVYVVILPPDIVLVKVMVDPSGMMLVIVIHTLNNEV